MALFVDLFPLTQQATDDALEFIFKSTHDRDAGIWKPHESPLIRRLVELFTKRGLDRLDHVREQIQAWVSGANHRSSSNAVPRPGMMERWTPAELDFVKLYLESLPPKLWDLDDHMMAVDFVVQRYLPADELRTEAEWLSTRAGLMGKVQANLAAAAVTAKSADLILAALPSTVGAAVTQFSLKAQQKAALDFARVRTAENVRALSEGVRHKMRATIVQHLENEQTKGSGAPAPSLQSTLLDNFATLNRDWRRIAVTEAGEAQLQGYIASLAPGTKVQRVEQYENACGFCKRIDGKVATVVSPDHPDKDPDNMVWVGKNNVGRSASPRKRLGDMLVHREPHELWWLPAGTAHPHCRGRWVPVIEDQPGDDPDFAAWLKATLST
jgi:hypothetical protein